jgi:ABC-type Mn2+/Zn2+ transport system permease subunit
LIAKRVIHIIIYSIFIGAIIPPLAIYFAFVLDISSGPTAVVAAFLLFIIVYFYKKIRF